MRFKKVVSKHGEMWRRMTPRQRAAFEQEAQILRDERMERLTRHVAKVAEDVRVCRAKLEDALVATNVPCRFSACKLTAGELDDCDRLLGRPSFQPGTFGNM